MRCTANIPGAVQDALLQHVTFCRRIAPQPFRTSLQQIYASRCSKSPSRRDWPSAATAENAGDTLEAIRENPSSLWRRASQIGSALGLCLAAGLFCTIRPASAAEQRYICHTANSNSVPVKFQQYQLLRRDSVCILGFVAPVLLQEGHRQPVWCTQPLALPSMA